MAAVRRGKKLGVYRAPATNRRSPPRAAAKTPAVVHAYREYDGWQEVWRGDCVRELSRFW